MTTTGTRVIRHLREHERDDDGKIWAVGEIRFATLLEAEQHVIESER